MDRQLLINNIVGTSMEDVSVQRLQESARQGREMALTGDDPVLKAGLLQLADKFEQEAAKMTANQPGHPSA